MTKTEIVEAIRVLTELLIATEYGDGNEFRSLLIKKLSELISRL